MAIRNRKIFMMTGMIIFLSVLSVVAVKSKPKVLVLGGTGRVGGSAVRALIAEDLIESIDVGGRSIDNYNDLISRQPITKTAGFKEIDIYNDIVLRESIKDYDIIVNTAGPFQGLDTSPVLTACCDLGLTYLDVCDDIRLSNICRNEENQKLAKNTNAKAVISTGIWPGASSLLAKKLIDNKEYVNGVSNVDDVKFSFYTAGSGGAGKTILTATFLLLGEDVLCYDKGNKIYKDTATDLYTINFGDKIGDREVARLNLIECESCGTHLLQGLNKNNDDISGVNVQTNFGTSPPFWNRLFAIMAKLIPKSLLKDRSAMDTFAAISLPMVRLVDSLVGSQNGIRVDIKTKNNEEWVGLLTHNDLERAVGDAIAAFVMNVDLIPNGGIYFPEEVPNEEFGKNILEFVSTRDCIESRVFKKN